MNNTKTFTKYESFVAGDEAASAIGKNGHGRRAYVAKIIGYDGLNIRREIMQKHIRGNYEFLLFNMDGDGLYEIRHFCTSRHNGRLWSAFLFISEDKVKVVSNQQALQISKSIECNRRR